MRVQLLAHTPDPERTAAAAARLCYSDSDISELLELETDKQHTLLRKILSLGHLSVLEHVSFSFGLEGVSRACTHQLVRHRVASYSQQSQRYVKADKRFAAVVPPTVTDRPELAERYDALMDQIHAFYGELLEAGVPAEDARFVLPNAAETKIVVSMNGRELRHFFALRCCRRAQWEIRLVAKEMLRAVVAVAPVLFEGAGPGCVVGGCPEGKMTCGAAAEVRHEYTHL